jgi:hypothetical protein
MPLTEAKFRFVLEIFPYSPYQPPTLVKILLFRKRRASTRTLYHRIMLPPLSPIIPIGHFTWTRTRSNLSLTLCVRVVAQVTSLLSLGYLTRYSPKIPKISYIPYIP